MIPLDWRRWCLVPLLAAFGACSSGGGGDSVAEGNAESCMTCHNGSPNDNYKGPGIENPHVFPGADNLLCTTCHGGDPNGKDKATSHVPPPPEIGDEQFQLTNRFAYFNRLTLTGIDKLPDYMFGGTTYTALDYLQFVNPGDLRVVTQGRACGQCHAGHAECVNGSLLATEAGIFSGAAYAIGVDHRVPASDDLYEDTASDMGFRAVRDVSFTPDGPGEVSELVEFPVISQHNQGGPGQLFNNPAYDAANLADDRNPDNTAITGSELANLFHEQVAFTCGDCHLGSAGANNRAGDFRSSGCSACHMPYSLGGRAGTKDPNVKKNEPLDPDDIDPPERAHPRKHRIVSRYQTLPGGKKVSGIDDYACAGCHQGSNRTVMQYWGIRLDQNADVAGHDQYPADPVSFKRTINDKRLFDPAVGNNTFNGRNANQYLLEEDYDGDGRDDTPADVHYEAGMGCIDCHGSYDLHGGDPMATDKEIHSRMEEAVAIRCESCHGSADAYATVQSGLGYDDQVHDLAVDAAGNLLRHVVREPDGNYWLTSKLTGKKHYIPQTRDTVVDSGATHPGNGNPLYSDRASYAMGRADGNATTGIGPHQTGGVTPGFSHMDNMSCASCHASWSNSCIGCHLWGEYTTNNNTFSNITGERIVFREDEALFTYQTPVPFQLGVDTDNKIGVISPNTDMWFRWEDRNNQRSDYFEFSNRHGMGADPAAGAPALSHNVLAPHSIRGRVESKKEGPRYCVACHLTDNALANFGTEYDAFRTAMENGDWGSLDFPLLTQHIGLNPGNQLDSPLWVHMVAGLGSGLYLFDENGCPVNPIDAETDRPGCEGNAPKDNFDPANVRYNLDRIVDWDGVSQGSNNHAMENPGALPNLRDGAANQDLAGPLGRTLVRKLTDPTNGIVLDSWLDANRDVQGDAGNWVKD